MTLPSLVSVEQVTERLIDYRGKTPPKTANGVRLVTAKVVKAGQILSEPAEYISDDFYDEWMRRGLPQQFDVLITTEAPLGEVAMLRTTDRIALAQRIILLRAKPDVVDPFYLFYALQSDVARAELHARASGTTVSGIKQSELRRVRIPVLPLLQQRRIAGILSAYDDLIENCERRIRVLDEMARALYREWFVLFRYPGHEKTPLVDDSSVGPIPTGWEAVPFYKLLASMSGGDWGSEEATEAETVAVAVVRGTDLDDIAHGRPLRTPLRYIKPSSFETRRLRQGDVIIENSVNAKTRSVGTTLLVNRHVLSRLGTQAIAASFCKVLRLHDPNLAPLVHLRAMHLREHSQMEYYQNVAANGIANFQAQRFARDEHLVLPSSETERSRLLQPVSPLFEKLGNLTAQVANLRGTRDLLLPRLLSGQLSVESAA